MSKANIVSEEIMLSVKDALGAFDPEQATKKGIRELRKVLQRFAQAKYPKKPKAPKVAKAAPAKAKAKK